MVCWTELIGLIFCKYFLCNVLNNFQQVEELEQQLIGGKATSYYPTVESWSVKKKE